MSFSKFLNVLTFVCYGMIIIAAGMVLDQLATGAAAGEVYGAAEISCERISYGLFFLGVVGFHVNLMRFLKSQPLKLFLTIFSPVLSIVSVFLVNSPFCGGCQRTAARSWTAGWLHLHPFERCPARWDAAPVRPATRRNAWSSRVGGSR